MFDWIVDRGILEYIDRRFQAVGMIDPQTHRLRIADLEFDQVTNTALSYA